MNSVCSTAAGIWSIRTVNLEQTLSIKSNVITQLLSYTHLWARVTLWTYQNVSILTSTQHILCYSPIQVGNVCAAMLSSSTPHQRAAIALHRGYGLSQPTMPQCPWWMTAQKLSPIFFRHPLPQHGSMQGTAPWRAESIQRMCRKTSLRCGVHNFT